MRFTSILTACLGLLAQHVESTYTTPKLHSRATNSSLPTKFGILLFPSFQLLDISGPLDLLNLLSWQTPISTKTRSAAMNPFNSTFGEEIVPTHTFSTAPADLDVLIVPGGVGTIAPDRGPVVEYIKTAFPSLQYLLTICTGAHLAAEAGVLDYRTATATKRSWAKLPNVGPKTNWIARARWVDDGKVWSSSGVSAGIDATLAWIARVYGEDVAAGLALGMEYERHEEASWDPFGVYYNLTDIVSWTAGGNRTSA